MGVGVGVTVRVHAADGGTLAWPDLECADAWKSRIDSWRSVILVAPENSVPGSG